MPSLRKRESGDKSLLRYVRRVAIAGAGASSGKWDCKAFDGCGWNCANRAARADDCKCTRRRAARANDCERASRRATATSTASGCDD